ncbi:MAG: hypothetical protein HQL86_03875 [Magnetococcales bacterium]|nr:hypothetical protein [Magnetococcales bacterium]
MSKILDAILPPMPAFLDMVSAQAEILAKCMSTAVDCLTDPEPIRYQALADLENSAKALRARHLDKLSDSFSTPIDRADLNEAIITLETPVEEIRETIEEMRALGVDSDKYLLEMAIVLRESASALQRGYSKLATKPGQADPDALAAIACPGRVDAIYRKGLGRLYTLNEDMEAIKARDEDIRIATFIHTVEILKRREAYRHMRSVSLQMGDAAEVLHTIVAQIG